MKITRRFLLGGVMAGFVQATFAQAPERSPRPLPRPALPAGATHGASAAEDLIAAAKLDGNVTYVVADARSGQVLEARRATLAMPPASTAKAITSLYALDRLGPAHRFTTRLIATGALQNGTVQGDLVLAGGGDPTLQTDQLAAMAQALRAAGVSGVTGRFLVWGGALPYAPRIANDQPEHVGYNPAVCGMNLNYNRVFFEWKPAGDGFNLTMDARYVWMNQKRIQGSHFAHLKQAAAANKLMLERRLDPCMSEVFPWAEIPSAHVKMLHNEHKPGNMAVLVQAPRTGLRTLEDVLDAGRGH